MRIVTDQTEVLVTKLVYAGTSRRNRQSGKPARLPPQLLPRLTQMVHIQMCVAQKHHQLARTQPSHITAPDGNHNNSYTTGRQKPAS